ncbi:MAG TPA: DUF2891 domain-containing protein, partial [Polyangia bacterium]|nr:DUF2891 domain-containing protein [Polyangia bacterium]
MKTALPALCLALTVGCNADRPEPTEQRPAPAVDPVRELIESLPEPGLPAFDAERAVSFARLSLACVEREYPNKPGDVLAGDHEVAAPRAIHPAFFGCFDWHSAVHGHWALVRVLKTFPKIGIAADIRVALDRRLRPEVLGRELRHFDASYNRLFERPYGWAWLLRLQAELLTWDDPDARRFAEALRPLASRLAELLAGYTKILSVPVRAGTHNSTAFAFTHALDYARAAGDIELERILVARSLDYFLADRDCPGGWEPSGEDFISPCLVEADLMRRVLPGPGFARWLDGFLPDPASSALEPLRRPAAVLDPEDPRVGHLI